MRQVRAVLALLVVGLVLVAACSGETILGERDGAVEGGADTADDEATEGAEGGDAGTDADLDADADGDADADADADRDADADADADWDADADADRDAVGALAVSMTSSHVGSAYIYPVATYSRVRFTLRFVNGGTADVTGVVVPGGEVTYADGSGTAFRLGPPSLTVGGGPFSGSIPAGGTVDVEGNKGGGVGGTLSCGSAVRISVNVGWDGAAAARVDGDTTAYACPF